MTFFFNELPEDQPEDKAQHRALKRVMKNDKIHMIKAKTLDDLCPRPGKNEQYRIITEKQFNAYALVLSLLKEAPIDDLYLAIYRINEPTVRSLIKLIDSGHIKKASFVICSFFKNTRRPEKWAIMLRDYCEKSPVCRHAYTNNHCKVLALKNETGHYVFEGSGNLSDNGRVEQYVYEESELMYNFHKEWITQLIDSQL